MRWNPIEQMQDVVNKFGTEERIKRFQSGELVLVERNLTTVKPVLLFERTARYAGGKFVTKQSFTKDNAKVKFGYIDERVSKLFGNVKEDVPAGELAVHTLMCGVNDPEIMVALGPQAKRFTKLGQFYMTLELQGLGQEGSLLVNGYANIAYILDENGAPWAVDAHWYSDGWYVGVYSVACRGTWSAGCQVLSQVA
jgi:hypothetical protein